MKTLVWGRLCTARWRARSVAFSNTANGWLKCNGAAFSSEMYPNLAKAYNVKIT